MWPDHAHIGRSLRVNNPRGRLIKAVYCIKVTGGLVMSRRDVVLMLAYPASTSRASCIVTQ